MHDISSWPTAELYGALANALLDLASPVSFAAISRFRLAQLAGTNFLVCARPERTSDYMLHNSRFVDPVFV